MLGPSTDSFMPTTSGSGIPILSSLVAAIWIKPDFNSNLCFAIIASIQLSRTPLFMLILSLIHI